MAHVNTSNCKKFLTENNDIRASPEAVREFQTRINSLLISLGKKVAAKVLSDKVKTATKEHVEDVFNSLELEEDEEDTSEDKVVEEVEEEAVEEEKVEEE